MKTGDYRGSPKARFARFWEPRPTPTDVGSSYCALYSLSRHFCSEASALGAFFVHCFRVLRVCLWSIALLCIYRRAILNPFVTQIVVRIKAREISFCDAVDKENRLENSGCDFEAGLQFRE